MRIALSLAALLALISCSTPAPRRPPEPVRAAPPVTAVATPPPPADWRDVPVTAGDWTYTHDDRGSVALFGPAGSDALIALRCDLGARRIYLSRAGDRSAALTVQTSSAVRTLPTRPAGGSPPSMAVALAPGDPLLDAIGFSRGRFVVEQAGSATLAVPAWPEIERVTEDCRR